MQLSPPAGRPTRSRSTPDPDLPDVRSSSSSWATSSASPRQPRSPRSAPGPAHDRGPDRLGPPDPPRPRHPSAGHVAPGAGRVPRLRGARRGARDRALTPSGAPDLLGPVQQTQRRDAVRSPLQLAVTVNAGRENRSWRDARPERGRRSPAAARCARLRRRPRPPAAPAPGSGCASTSTDHHRGRGPADPAVPARGRPAGGLGALHRAHREASRTPSAGAFSPSCGPPQPGALALAPAHGHPTPGRGRPWSAASGGRSAVSSADDVALAGRGNPAVLEVRQRRDAVPARARQPVAHAGPIPLPGRSPSPPRKDYPRGVSPPGVGTTDSVPAKRASLYPHAHAATADRCAVFDAYHRCRSATRGPATARRARRGRRRGPIRDGARGGRHHPARHCPSDPHRPGIWLDPGTSLTFTWHDTPPCSASPVNSHRWGRAVLGGAELRSAGGSSTRGHRRPDAPAGRERQRGPAAGTTGDREVDPGPVLGHRPHGEGHAARSSRLVTLRLGGRRHQRGPALRRHRRSSRWDLGGVHQAHRAHRDMLRRFVFAERAPVTLPFPDVPRLPRDHVRTLAAAPPLPPLSWSSSPPPPPPRLSISRPSPSTTRSSTARCHRLPGRRSANDSDPDGDALSYVSVTPAGRATSICTPVCCTTGRSSRPPVTDSFTYTVSTATGTPRPPRSRSTCGWTRTGRRASPSAAPRRERRPSRGRLPPGPPGTRSTAIPSSSPPPLI